MAEKSTTPKKKTTSKAATKPASKTTRAAAASKSTVAKKEAPVKTSVGKSKEAQEKVKKPRKKRDFKQTLHRASLVAKTAYWTVWSLIGLALVVGSIMSFVNEEPLVETLNITATSSTTAGATAPPPSPGGPTDDQLACVEERVGVERFEELRQGFPATEEENQIINDCFSS